ncbi:MAG: DUF3833 family protein [Alphaproteobacteria bacterium]
MRTIFVLAAALILSACGSMSLKSFEGTTPPLVLEDYFAGDTRAWGIFEDRFGNLRAQFTVDIKGTWNEPTLVLEEDFLYASGRADRRVWTLTKSPTGAYSGTAGDVIGAAAGAASGNAFNWTYVMDLPVGDRTIRVRLNDWLWLQPDGVLINRARVTKFGVELGELTIFFKKP